MAKPRQLDRGPELKGFAPVFRSGSHLFISTQIPEGPARLFLIDTGSTATIVSTNAAEDVTKVHKNSGMRVRGLSGTVKDVRFADKVILMFAGFRQVNQDVITLDLSSASRSEGTEISGIMGLPLLSLLRLTLDYRDGVVKFERAVE